MKAYFENKESEMMAPNRKLQKKDGEKGDEDIRSLFSDERKVL